MPVTAVVEKILDVSSPSETPGRRSLEHLEFKVRRRAVG